MIRLLKFEFLKKWKMSLGVLIGYFIIYFAALMKFKSSGTYELETMGFGLVFFIVLSSGLFFAAGISAINSLRVEVKNSSRDLYFSLPLTAYTKVGSKLIVATVECLLASVIGVVATMKAFQSLTGVNVLQTFINEIKQLTLMENIFSVYLIVIGGLMLLLIIYLSFAIMRSFFSQVKFGGFVTVIIYVGLMYLCVKYAFPHMSIQPGPIENSIPSVLMMTGFTGLLFFLVGFLFEHKASFD